MEKYRVRIYAHAQGDLEDIITYLNTLSPQAAEKEYALIIGKIASLADMPERCPNARDIFLRSKGYRYLIVENYLVFFVIREEIVQVRRIIYGSRNYQWLL